MLIGIRIAYHCTKGLNYPHFQFIIDVNPNCLMDIDIACITANHVMYTAIKFPFFLSLHIHFLRLSIIIYFPSASRCNVKSFPATSPPGNESWRSVLRFVPSLNYKTGGWKKKVGKEKKEKKLARLLQDEENVTAGKINGKEMFWFRHVSLYLINKRSINNGVIK